MPALRASSSSRLSAINSAYHTLWFALGEQLLFQLDALQSLGLHVQQVVVVPQPLDAHGHDDGEGHRREQQQLRAYVESAGRSIRASPTVGHPHADAAAVDHAR